MIILRSQSQYSHILCFNKKNWLFHVKTPLCLCIFYYFWLKCLETSGCPLTYCLFVKYPLTPPGWRHVVHFWCSPSILSYLYFSYIYVSLSLKRQINFSEGRNELGPGTQTHWHTLSEIWHKKELVQGTLYV